PPPGAGTAPANVVAVGRGGGLLAVPRGRVDGPGGDRAALGADRDRVGPPPPREDRDSGGAAGGGRGSAPRGHPAGDRHRPTGGVGGAGRDGGGAGGQRRAGAYHAGPGGGRGSPLRRTGRVLPDPPQPAVHAAIRDLSGAVGREQHGARLRLHPGGGTTGGRGVVGDAVAPRPGRGADRRAAARGAAEPRDGRGELPPPGRVGAAVHPAGERHRPGERHHAGGGEEVAVTAPAAANGTRPPVGAVG